MKLHVVFYSMYTHVYRLAEAIAEGARSVPGAEVSVFQVAETLPDEVLEKMHAKDVKASFADVPVAKADDLRSADAILFGTPTRYENVCAQMQAFMDSTGQLWASGALVGKVGSVFTSTATQHGGQETTIRNFHTELLHHGMVIVGVPYGAKELSNMAEVSGGTPYGASTMAGTDGSRAVSENELAIARFQGKHVAEIAAKLAAK